MVIRVELEGYWLPQTTSHNRPNHFRCCLLVYAIYTMKSLQFAVKRSIPALPRVSQSRKCYPSCGLNQCLLLPPLTASFVIIAFGQGTRKGRIVGPKERRIRLEGKRGSVRGWKKMVQSEGKGSERLDGTNLHIWTQHSHNTRPVSVQTLIPPSLVFSDKNRIAWRNKLTTTTITNTSPATTNTARTNTQQIQQERIHSKYSKNN